MNSQIFKQQIPTELLFSLMDLNSSKNDKYYTFDNISFKKGIFNQSILEFLIKCKPYYYLSKYKYIDRKLTYNSFTTILRQICNFNKIIYTSQIKYDKSDYNIVYYVHF